jgi:ligand-binding sensor domain-containing protein
VNSAIPVNHISSVLFENDSVRWIATINGGLAKMTNDSFVTFNAVNASLPDNSIIQIARDTNDFLWLACPSGGLVREYNENFSVFNMNTSGIPTNSLNSLAIDSLQNIYIGSYDKGLIKKEGNYFYSWNTSNSLMPDDVVFCVAVERTGIIWAGTDAHGVVRFDENLWLNTNEQFERLAVQIYPNPVTNQSRLLLSKYFNPDHLTLTIFDASGKQVGDSFVFPNALIDVENLEAGIYFFRVVDDNQVVGMGKFIKGQ